MHSGRANRIATVAPLIDAFIKSNNPQRGSGKKTHILRLRKMASACRGVLCIRRSFSIINDGTEHNIANNEHMRDLSRPRATGRATLPGQYRAARAHARANLQSRLQRLSRGNSPLADVFLELAAL
jgi:hypothetical protein